MQRLLLLLFWTGFFLALMSCATTIGDWQQRKAREPLKPGAWYAGGK